MALMFVQVFVLRLRKYIGSYLVHLEGKTDAIVFSAGASFDVPFMCVL